MGVPGHIIIVQFGDLKISIQGGEGDGRQAADLGDADVVDRIHREQQIVWVVQKWRGPRAVLRRREPAQAIARVIKVAPLPGLVPQAAVGRLAAEQNVVLQRG